MNARHGALLALLALCGSGCASVPTQEPGPRDVVLRNAGFELDGEAGRNCAPQWGCSMHADPTSFRFVIDESFAAEGRRSLRIEPTGKEPWALATQGIRDSGLPGARLRFSLAVRLEGVTGNGAGPIFIAQSTGGATITHRQELAKGTSDWKRIAIEFEVPRETALIEVGAVLEGAGRVWLDDARLEVVRPRELQKNPV